MPAIPNPPRGGSGLRRTPPERPSHNSTAHVPRSAFTPGHQTMPSLFTMSHIRMPGPKTMPAREAPCFLNQTASTPSPDRDGGAGRDRTDDLMLAKHALSQLSYGPLGWSARTGLVGQALPSMVGLGRLERPTSPLSGVRSNHLSYRPSRPGRSVKDQAQANRCLEVREEKRRRQRPA